VSAAVPAGSGRRGGERPRPVINPATDVARSYDAIAEIYARRFGAELRGKPLDRAILGYVAEQAAQRGVVGDLGCGPGHVAAHLARLGADVVGVDISTEMIQLAAAGNPGLRFVVGDLRRLPLADASLAAAVAFYSLIHLERDEELALACAEIARVLEPGGEAVVAYHRGNRSVKTTEMWGVEVDLTFRFLPDRTAATALERAGLELVATLRRGPYPGIEQPTPRSYLIARRPGAACS
jgi:SAM-dependent methyltransferase